MRLVLDASAFFAESALAGELFTTPTVIAELHDLSSKVRADLLCEAGLQVVEPDRGSVRKVWEQAVAKGEAGVLSPTDIDLLALALQLGAGVLSDDYALQNVARALGIRVTRLRQEGARHLKWKFRCSGCGRYAHGPGECLVCGAQIQRTLK